MIRDGFNDIFRLPFQNQYHDVFLSKDLLLKMDRAGTFSASSHTGQDKKQLTQSETLIAWICAFISSDYYWNWIDNWIKVTFCTDLWTLCCIEDGRQLPKGFAHLHPDKNNNGEWKQNLIFIMSGRLHQLKLIKSKRRRAKGRHDKIIYKKNQIWEYAWIKGKCH